MIRKAKALMDFPRYSIPEKIGFGNAVIKGLTDNASIFTNPDIPVADLETLNEDLKRKASAASTRDHPAVVAMHASVKPWNAAFRTNADYVTRIANGSAVNVSLSGYHCTKTKTDLPAALGEVRNITVTQAGTGKIQVRIDKLRDAAFYLYLITHSADGVFISRVSKQLLAKDFNGWFALKMDTRLKVTFDGLTSGDLIRVQVIGMNSTGMGIIMHPAEFRVP